GRGGGWVAGSVIEETVRHTMLQLADPLGRFLAGIDDEDRKTAVDGRPLEEGTDDALAGTLDIEDLPLLLALCRWRGQLHLREASHLVLDEAEDFSLFDLTVLAGLFRAARRPPSPGARRSRRWPASPPGGPPSPCSGPPAG